MPDAATRTAADTRFSRLLRINDYLHTRRKRQFTRCQAAYERAVVAAYFAANPKRKRRDFNDIATSNKKADRALVQPILAKWKATADAEYEKYKVVLERLEQLLDDAADAVTLAPLPDTIYTKYATHDTYMYRQGRSYAKAAAERSADKPRHLDIPVHVVERPYGFYKKAPLSAHHITAFDVWVALNPLHTSALKRKCAGPSFVESVRLCWARGVNPRVYWPMLPHGFEEKHGLDFFGNYKADVTPAWKLSDFYYLWRDNNGTLQLWGIPGELKHGPGSIRDIEPQNRHGWVRIDNDDGRLGPLRAVDGIPVSPGESVTVAQWYATGNVVSSRDTDYAARDRANRWASGSLRLRLCSCPSATYRTWDLLSTHLPTRLPTPLYAPQEGPRSADPPLPVPTLPPAVDRAPAGRLLRLCLSPSTAYKPARSPVLSLRLFASPTSTYAMHEE